MGWAGCADAVDIGETAYAMALADDLDGDGRTDLVVSTMNGVVYCFEAASSRFHPLHAWPAQARPPHMVLCLSMLCYWSVKPCKCIQCSHHGRYRHYHILLKGTKIWLN